MFSVAFGLALASSAAAQSVIGMSSVPTTGATAYNMPIATGASGYAQASAAASSAPPSQYTPPPSYSSDSMMPYSSFTAGGYSSMACGYGYQKGSDGKCSAMSWYTDSGCYETIIINHSQNCYQSVETMTVTMTETATMTETMTVPTTVLQTMTDFMTVTKSIDITMTEIMTSTDFVPTTRVWVSTQQSMRPRTFTTP